MIGYEHEFHHAVVDFMHAIETGEAIQPATFPFSPYVEQSAYYDSILAGLEPGSYDVILETNRGCPYGCSFCD